MCVLSEQQSPARRGQRCLHGPAIWLRTRRHRHAVSTEQCTGSSMSVSCNASVSPRCREAGANERPR